MTPNGLCRCLLFSILLGLNLPAAAALTAGKVLEADRLSQTRISLSPYFAILEDPKQTLTPADMQKTEIAARFKTDAAKTEALSFGYTRSAYWLRLSLANTGDSPVERILEIGYARLSSIQLHQPLANGLFQSSSAGMDMPFAARPYPNRFFVFPITLPAHSEHTYYLRVASKNTLLVPARLWEPRAFHQHERNDYLSQAWYFGMATAMILFNLLLFVSLRDVIYLLYVNFVTIMALAFAEQSGLATEFLWTDSPRWTGISTGVCYSATFAALLTFTRHMLNTWKVAPRLDRLIKISIGIYLLIPFGLAVAYPYLITWLTLFHLVTSALVLYTGLFCIVKRQRSAIFFVAAFTVLCLGGTVGALRALAWVPTNFFTTNLLQLGSSIEMLLLALALADRFNGMRLDKAKAQKEALEAQQRLVENLRSSEHILETRVAERTAELQILNRKLEALSTTDGLTGIANRRRFDEVLANEWNRAERLAQPLALAMIDIDWFKKYNDRYGHQAGDECLQAVAAVLSANICRTGDLVARYGGEEFAFIAPATGGVIALDMARKVCAALQATALPHPMSVYGQVTVSIGIAAMVPNQQLSPDILLKSADEALYCAKKQGRNRAVLAAQS